MVNPEKLPLVEQRRRLATWVVTGDGDASTEHLPRWLVLLRVRVSQAMVQYAELAVAEAKKDELRAKVAYVEKKK